MAHGYLRTPPPSPLPTPLTNAELLRVIATQIERIANTLHSIAHALAIDNLASHWEIRALLQPPYNREGLQCPPPPKTTKSSAEF